MQAICIALLLVILALPRQPAWPSSGSLTAVGAYPKWLVNSTGFRQRLNLVPRGGLLIGRAEHGPIGLIAVDAPGCGKSHLILRVLDSEDVEKSILLTAPACLSKNTRRATIYFKDTNESRALFEHDGDSWNERSGQIVRTSPDGGQGPSITHLAFSVKHLGLYRLTTNDSGIILATSLTERSSPGLLAGGGIVRGLMTWVWAVILLAVCWLAAIFVHRREEDR